MHDLIRSRFQALGCARGRRHP